MEHVRSHPVVPAPRCLMELDAAAVELGPETAIDATPELAATVRRVLGPGTGLELPRAAGGDIEVRLDAQLPPEGYRLRIDGRVRIVAADPAGVNWASQTLRQFLPPSASGPAPVGEPLRLTAVAVEDSPRFPWRGLMVDVARHFVPVAELFRIVDMLAMHKLNRLQLHLSDDQGWRLESVRFPEVHRVGATRRETQGLFATEGDGTPHGGYYLRSQLRALVRYARDRGVVVVPEIDLPSHAGAFLAAFPRFAATHISPRPATAFEPTRHVVDLSEDCLHVVEEILEEVLEVFDSEHIHLGGDECPTDQWAANPEVMAEAAGRGLASARDLQPWFTRRMSAWLRARGRRLVGWDEIADAGAVEGAVVQVWRRADTAARIAADGMAVILCPQESTYLDYYPSTLDTEAAAIGGVTTVADVYRLDPLAGIPSAAAHRVLGAQAQLWGECVPSTRRLEYLLFPRLVALAEVAWSEPEVKDWARFHRDLPRHLERLDAAGIEYRPLDGPHPWQEGGTGVHRKPDRHRGPDGPENPFDATNKE